MSPQTPSQTSAAIAATLIMALLLTGCGSGNESVSGWLASDSTQTIFVRLTQADGSVVGTLRVARLEGEEIRTVDAGFDGSISGGDLLLRVEGFFGDTLTGTINDDRLTLLFPYDTGELVPIEFHRATVEDFNAMVSGISREGQAARSEREEGEAIEAAFAELQESKRRLREAVDAATTKPMLDAVENAEDRLDTSVEGAIARLEALAAVGSGDEFAKEDIRFALDEVAFAIDGMGFEVNGARGLLGEEGLPDALTTIAEAVARVHRADADFRSLASDRPDTDAQLLIEAAERKRIEIESTVGELRDRLTRLSERARDRWEYALSVVQAAGVDVDTLEPDFGPL